MDGGKQPEDVNASLLVSLAAQLAKNGRIVDAIRAADMSLRLRADAATGELIAYLRNVQRSRPPLYTFLRSSTALGRTYQVLSGIPIVAAVVLSLWAFALSAKEEDRKAKITAEERESLAFENLGINAERSAIDQETSALKALNGRMSSMEEVLNNVLNRYPNRIPESIRQQCLEIVAEHDRLVKQYNDRSANLSARIDGFNLRIDRYNKRAGHTEN